MRSSVRLTGCKPATGATVARQGDVERLGAQLQCELVIGQLLAAGRERGFDRLLGDIDGGAARLLFVDRQGSHAFHQLGDAPGLAKELCLGVLEFGRRLRVGESSACGGDQGVQLVHKRNSWEK